jgi:ribonuclease BN (tRNA processing enzyme)
VESPTGVLAYTGDTGVTDALVSLAQDADLFLAEATLAVTDTGPHGHLSASDAATAAAGAGVRQLVLTHFQSADPQWLEARRAEASAVFDGPVHMAAPNLQLRCDSTTSV